MHVTVNATTLYFDVEGPQLAGRKGQLRIEDMHAW
jgi:hypothetical protein